MPSRILTHGLVAVAAFILGWALHPSNHDAPAAPAEPTVTPLIPELPVPVAAETRVGDAPNLSRADERRLLLQWAMERRVSMNARMFEFSGELTPEFVDLFGLTSAETHQIEQLISAAREQLRQMAAGVATASHSEDGSQWVIEVPPFADAAAPVFDHVHANLARVLGPERNGALVALFEHQLDDHLETLGVRRRTLIFELEPEREGPQLLYKYVDKSFTPYGESSGQNRVHAAFMREQLGPLTSLLPPEWRE